MSTIPGTKILWYLKHIDGRHPWTAAGRYEPDFGRLIRTAKALDQSGFYGALHGTSNNDPLVSVAALIAATERLRFLIPVYPGLTNPRLLAKQALTFDQYSGGRLLINIVNGQDPQLRPYGQLVPHERRYAQSVEYWRLFTSFYEGGPGVYDGTYLDTRHVTGDKTQVGAPISADHLAGIPYGPFQTPHVPLWGAGASPAGQDHAGQIVEVYLSFLRGFDAVAAQVRAARAAAARHGREFQGVGIHGSLIVRRTTRQAEDAFYEGLAAVGAEQFAADTDERIRRTTGGTFDLSTFVAPDAQRQGWIDALRAGRLPTLDELRIEPGVYAGLTEFIPLLDYSGGGAATYLVGAGEEVAARLRRYRTEIPGVDRFIFSGWPLEEEALQVADHLFPYIDDLES
ncbi:LLM class flavin-dependent oxidoreductase [Microbacterium sp. MYb66]|uniref:LLM class flavin-dependent oxidoreductase n=1 Tax=Microbacterium sp. MYb66 TaxID=1848692 RepID=UPI0015E318F9|nr:LLM class flavin-dependent oxidoreductase [Microbacterium sp. MYb66]